MNKQHEASKIMQEFITDMVAKQDTQAKLIAELSEKVGRLEKTSTSEAAFNHYFKDKNKNISD